MGFFYCLSLIPECYLQTHKLPHYERVFLISGLCDKCCDYCVVGHFNAIGRYSESSVVLFSHMELFGYPGEDVLSTTVRARRCLST
jgi:hypothetical protein